MGWRARRLARGGGASYLPRTDLPDHQRKKPGEPPRSGARGDLGHMRHDLGVDERLAIVRELWSTYREDGVHEAIPLLHADVEFVDHEGRVFDGREGVARFFAEFEERGERFMASIYTFELHEPDVLVIGHRRIRSKEGLSGDYLYFVHGFRDGRVSRLSAHTTREAALADIEAHAAGRA
jgi:predicted SnoaL-like aldol condensation-catalyzing enzyme